MPLFRRYSAVMFATFSLLTALLLMLLTASFRRGQAEQLEGHQREVADAAQTFDYLLRTSVLEVEQLEQSARWYLEMGDQQPADPLVDRLTQTSTQPPRYSLAEIPTRRGRPLSGALNGMGLLSELDAGRRRELSMALHLNTHFRAVQDQVKNAAWIYYVSARGFFNLYPPPSEPIPFSRELYDTDGYRLSTPAENPKGETRWTPAYVDFGGKGLMVTCAKPVYHEGRFLGQVGLDLTLGRLSALLRELRPRWGELAVVNGEGQLLAHPTLVDERSQEVPRLAQAMPTLAGLRLFHAPLPQESEDAWVFSHELAQAPWVLIAVAPKGPMHAALVSRSLNLALFVFFGLLLMLVVGQLVIRRDFVRPARRLLKHIDLEAKGDGRIPDLKIHDAWRPWFTLITDTFREKNEAQRKLQLYSESLEARVLERTRDLDAQNAELERALDRLNGAQEQLISQARIVSFGTLAVGIAHEVNSPVGAIRASCDVAKRASERVVERLDPEARVSVDRALQALGRSLDTMSEAAARLSELVSRLLAFESLAGAPLEPIGVDSEVEEAAAMLRPRLPAGITLATALGTSGVVGGVPHEIRHLVYNLLENAREAVGDDGEIRVMTGDDGDYVRIQVEDTGCGMSDAQRAQLFDAAFTIKERRVGAGIGLKVVKAVVDRLGGQIEVESTPGAGSRFTVRLPRFRDGHAAGVLHEPRLG